LAWGLARGVRAAIRGERSALALAAAASLALLALLCVPARKSWHHGLVAWPLLALVAGAAAGPWLEKLAARAPRAALGALAAATLLALAAAAGGTARLFPARCIVPAELVPRLPRGSDVLVIAPEPDWKLLGALAAEYDLKPWPATTL